MHTLQILCVLLVGFASYAIAQPILAGFDNMLNFTDMLSPDGFTEQPTYFVVYYTATKESTSFGIVCDSGPTGWCALGFSPEGLMTGSDAAVGYRDDTNSKDYVIDFILKGRNPPTTTCTGDLTICTDEVAAGGCADDFTQITTSRDTKYLIFKFTRPTKATDACDREIPLNTDTNVVFSIGSVNAQSTKAFPLNMLKHRIRTLDSNGPAVVQFKESIPSSTTGQVSTTAKPSTTAKATTAAATTAHATSAAGTTAASTTAVQPCPNLQKQCQDICGSQEVKSCTCTNNLPSAMCGVPETSDTQMLAAVCTAFHLMAIVFLTF